MRSIHERYLPNLGNNNGRVLGWKRKGWGPSIECHISVILCSFILLRHFNLPQLPYMGRGGEVEPVHNFTAPKLTLTGRHNIVSRLCVTQRHPMNHPPIIKCLFNLMWHLCGLHCAENLWVFTLFLDPQLFFPAPPPTWKAPQDTHKVWEKKHRVCMLTLGADSIKSWWLISMTLLVSWRQPRKKSIL